MRRLLAAAAMTGIAALAAVLPAEAKPIWLKCGGQVIILNSDTKSFSLTYLEKIYSGGAQFNSEQIIFSFPNLARESMVVRTGYTINRKTLEYEEAIVESIFGTPWKLFKYDDYPNPMYGKCSIMKNQI
jgi:hypothetical protein